MLYAPRRSQSEQRALTCGRRGACGRPTSAFGFNFLWAAAPKLAADLLGFVGPFASQYIIEWLETPEAPYWIGFAWAFALLLAPFLQTVFVNQYFLIAFNTGMHVRAPASARAPLSAPPESRSEVVDHARSKSRFGRRWWPPCFASPFVLAPLQETSGRRYTCTCIHACFFSCPVPIDIPACVLERTYGRAG